MRIADGLLVGSNQLRGGSPVAGRIDLAWASTPDRIHRLLLAHPAATLRARRGGARLPSGSLSRDRTSRARRGRA